MKKITKIAFVLILCVFLISCSTTVDFVVINKSDQTIEVDYKLSYEIESFEGIYFLPDQMSLSDWNSWFNNKNEMWKKPAKNEIKIDSTTSRVKLKLAPKQVLRLTNEDDSIYFNDEGENGFSIQSLKLSGKNGVLVFDTDRVFKQFERRSFTKRFIEYK